MVKVQTALNSNLVSQWVLIGVPYRHRNDLETAVSPKPTPSQLTKAENLEYLLHSLKAAQPLRACPFLVAQLCEPLRDSMAGLCCF